MNPDNLTDRSTPIILIGPYPPPYGGISVYISRLEENLRKEGWAVETWDFMRMNICKKIFYVLKVIFIPEKTLFYLNLYNTPLLIALILRPFKKIVVIKDHAQREIATFRSFSKSIIRYFINKKLDQLLLTGEHLKDFYKSQNFPIPDNIKIEHAYLPPNWKEESAINGQYPKSLIKFLEDHRPVMIANAFSVTLYKNIDLYGFDMCVESLNDLKGDFPTIGLVFAFSRIDAPDHFKKIQSFIKSNNLEGHIYLFQEGIPIWPLFKRANIMLRPTFSDAYGFSIDEAIDCGCIAVASDACERNEKAIIFKNRDQIDFNTQIKKALNGSTR